MQFSISNQGAQFSSFSHFIQSSSIVSLAQKQDNEVVTPTQHIKVAW